MTPPLLVAIDTSCDETSVAVTRGQEVLSNVISSQVRQHRKFGGVVPFLAQRLHKERIAAVYELALQRAKVSEAELEGVAVTYGPGLAPCLEVGLEFARQLAERCTIPFYPINHMLGHVVSVVAGSKQPLQYPALAILVSGKHSEWVLLRSVSDLVILGATLDDAIGEAYDKVARLLGLGYPGGKVVASLAKQGDPMVYPLPVPMLRNPGLDISYSGLKTAVKYLVEDLQKQQEGPLSATTVADLCASFEQSAQEGLVHKVKLALKQYPEVRQVLLGGGVAANVALRKRLRTLAKQAGAELLTPPSAKLCTDNAAMIGVAAWLQLESGALVAAEPASVDRVPQLSFPRLQSES